MTSHRTTRRRWMTRVGVVLVVAGSLVLGYVAWQLWGTSWQSQRKHVEIVEQLDREWREGVELSTTTDGVAGAVIRIPRFGEDYAVPVLAGVADEALAAGFGHFEESAGPGEVGNFALAAHRITHGEPLRDMPGLRVGDEVVVETATAVHTYVLDTPGDALVVPFTEIWVVDALPTNPRPGGVQPPSQEPGQRLITLTTCSEIFHTDDRMIAFGHLVDSAEK